MNSYLRLSYIRHTKTSTPDIEFHSLGTNVLQISGLFVIFYCCLNVFRIGILCAILTFVSVDNLLSASRSGFWDIRTYLLTYLFTYLLTPWSRVLEKLTGSQLVKKFSTFYGTRKHITSFTSDRHLPLS